MKLDRNLNPDGRGKYALLKLRRQAKPFTVEMQRCAEKLNAAGLLDFGGTPQTDFFVIRLKDKFAGPALRGYANAITAHLATLPARDRSRKGLVEYHHEIIELAEQAAANPCQRIPD